MSALDRIVMAEITAGTSVYTVKGLDMSFDVNAEEEQATTAQIRIYNLSENIVNDIQQNNSKIVLSAGKETVDVVFQGDIFFCQPIRDTTNAVDTEILLDCFDGGIGYLSARFSRSYTAGVMVSKIYKDIAASLGLTLKLDATNVLTAKRLRASCFDGQAKDVLKNLNREYRVKAKLRDGALYIGEENAVINSLARKIPLLSVDTGLIGLPVVAFERVDNKNYNSVEGDIVLPPGLNAYGETLKKTIYRKTISCTSLLNVDYVVGGQFKLETEKFTSTFNKDLGKKSKGDANGIYYIRSIVHTGGTGVDAGFSTIIEGVPI